MSRVPGRIAAMLVAVAAVTALAGPALAGPAAVAGTTVARSTQVGAGGGGCVAHEDGSWVVVSCQSGTVSGGRAGSPGAAKYVCTFVPMPAGQAALNGLPRAPKGERWVYVDCPGSFPWHGVALIRTATGAPAITPQQLLQVALGEFRVPALGPATAPPRGRDGLAGLPEWFWIPAAGWHPRSVTVTAGPVWATATATPERLSFSPGPGLSGPSCPGPGTPYNPKRPAGAQRTACSYTYDQGSAGQPGGTYQAAVTVIWRVTWTGSGGAGGVVNAGLRTSYPFALRVTEGQALVTGQ
jgi:hypothetical protein